MEAQSEETPANLFRRHHKKSRFGCRNCKQRRIKCDEARPSCSNCIRRKVRCDFLPQSSFPDASTHDKVALPSASTSQTPGTRQQRPVETRAELWRTMSDPNAAWTIKESYQKDDLKALHHYSTTLSYVLAQDAQSTFWQFDVPHAAFNDDATMQMMLALASIHTTWGDASASLSHSMRSHSYDRRSKGVQLLTQQMTMSDAPSSMFLSATLLGMHTLALGPTKGRYLLYSEEDDPENFTSLLVGRKAAQMQRDRGLPLTPQALSGPHAAENSTPGPSREADLTEAIFEYKMHLCRIQVHIESLIAEDETFVLYAEAARQLEECFKFVYGPHKLPYSTEGAWFSIMSWLFTVSDGFVAALQKKRPFALIIFAHLPILLHQINAPWIVQDWPRHILGAIERQLPRSFHDWLQWPHVASGLRKRASDP